MNYIMAVVVGIILTLLSHIIYRINGESFYIAFSCGGIVMIIFNSIADLKKRKKKL